MGDAGESDAEARRRLRFAELERLSDAGLLEEVRAQAGSRWRATRLREHTKKHRQEFEQRLGRALGPTEVERLSGTCWRRRPSSSRALSVTGCQRISSAEPPWKAMLSS